MMNDIFRKIVLIASLLFASESHAGLYDIQTTFTDEFGKQFSLSKMKGQTTIVSMAYTSCKGSCPVIIQKMKMLNQEFLKKGKKLKFLIVTFDPETDTPAVLHEYRKKTDFHDDNFIFLHASPKETRKFSMHVGIRYSKDTDDSIMHDNKITAVSKTGKVLAEQDNLNQSFDDFIKKVLNET
jgi:protein SCO1/2